MVYLTIMSNLNPHLTSLGVDVLYHLGLDSAMDLKGMFGDVRFVCMGGSPVRAEAFARQAAMELDGGPYVVNLVGKTERFSLYKAGPVISVSHGMGMPSMSILLHELTKLLHYAGCRDVPFIRIGTSGGIGVDAGTVVVPTEGLSGSLEPVFRQRELGKLFEYSTQLDQSFTDVLVAQGNNLPVESGKTLGTHDFYEGQARMDGALLTSYSTKDAQNFLKKLFEKGVRNIEMESTYFAAFCKRAGIRGAIVCVTLLDRLSDDQIVLTPADFTAFSDRAQTLVLRWMKEEMQMLEKQKERECVSASLSD